MALSTLTEVDDASDLLTEEYERLQDQIRIIQNEREKEAEDMKVKIGKCKKEIQVIDKENEELRTLLSLAKSEQNHRRDMKVIETLKTLVAAQDNLRTQIDQEKQYGKQLDTEKVNGFCEVLAYSESVRHQIEKMRAERKIYANFQHKLQEKSTQLSKANSTTIQQATLTYEHRAEIKSRCQALVERNEKEKVTFELETRDLRRVIDHNKQLNHFMKVKGDERTKWKVQTEARRQVHGSTGYIARKQQQNKINECSSAMNSIQKITGHKGVNQIIQYYNLNDDENFKIFNYVTEVNDQIEDLEQEIKEINVNATRCTEEQKAREEKNHAEMHRLEVKMNRDRRYVEESEKQIGRIHKILDEIKLQIRSLAIKLDCDLSNIVNMIAGDGDQVTERNLMLYLSVLEQRVDELLSIKRFAKDKTDSTDMPDDGKSDMALGAVDLLHSKPQTLELPTMSDDDEEDDYRTVKPLTQAELLEKVTRKVLYKSRSLANMPHLNSDSETRLTGGRR